MAWCPPELDAWHAPTPPLPPVVTPAVVSPVSAPPTHSINAPHIVGIEAVDDEDIENVKNLMLYALTIKCQDGNLFGTKYERAKQWRVEIRDGEYLLLLLDWKTISYSELGLIWGWDQRGGDSRNIVNLYVTDAPLNDDPKTSVRTVVINYLSEKTKRRRIARNPRPETHPADYGEDDAQESRGRKRTLMGAFNSLLSS